jgi:amidohydrolase
MTETPIDTARPTWAAELDEWLSEHGDELVGIRRQIHMRPELGHEEHATTELVAERLRLAGLEPRVLACGTGLVCDIDPDDVGTAPRTALRADLDALPMQDEKDVPYRSQVPGVSHACGHDVHTTVVLGAGLFLARNRHLLPGPVRLLFQPAEELIPGGALDLLDDGALDGVGSVLGLHCEPRLDAGRIGLRTGAITSAADMIEIHLHGPGGHTARPQETVDLLQAVADVIRRVPDLVRARLAPLGPVLVVFGAVKAGGAGNVIPTHAMLRGSVRTQSLEAWEEIATVVTAAVAEVAADHGAGHRVVHHPGVPPVVNDAGVIGRIEQAARHVLAPDSVAEASQSWGGDDFAYLSMEAPGAYVRLGVHRPGDTGPRLDLHAGHFDIDETAIPVGVRVLVGTVCTPDHDGRPPA